MGSSPLTRGKRGPCGWPAGRARLIPAHAGKTDAKLWGDLVKAAHPRSRGENEWLSRPLPTGPGSSPLTRGKQCQGSESFQGIRLIPAHAGKTVSQPRPSAYARAHPRSRGENVSMRIPTRRTLGSSPLTRGKRRHGDPRGCRRRLIPAHAGKTACSWTAKLTLEAHPRSRGENNCLRGRSVRSPGSSPLTRGKPGRARNRVGQLGLIPAHAGKTVREGMTAIQAAAHPRSRGENTLDSASERDCGGSSPLTRGKRCCGAPPSCLAGLIPAHAGKTTGRRCTRP